MSQNEDVIVTSYGKPTALMIGIQGQDWEDLMLQTNPSFWTLIEKRRKDETISLHEMKKRLKHID